MVPHNRLAIRGQDWICVCPETYVMIIFHDIGEIINILINPIVAYTNLGGGHCTNDCVFRWCDGPCSKLQVPGDSNSFSYFDDIPTTGDLWGKRDHKEKIIMAQFRYNTGECNCQSTRICVLLDACRYITYLYLPTMFVYLAVRLRNSAHHGRAVLRPICIKKPGEKSTLAILICTFSNDMALGCMQMTRIGSTH